MVPDISVVIPLRHEAPKLAELYRQLKERWIRRREPWKKVMEALVLV